MIQTSLFDKPTIRTYAGDVTARKHGGNQRSVEAFAKVNVPGDCEKIVEYLRTHKDGTSKEIAANMGKHLHQISGRFVTLNGKYIVRTGFKRENADVWRLI